MEVIAIKTVFTRNIYSDYFLNIICLIKGGIRNTRPLIPLVCLFYLKDTQDTRLESKFISEDSRMLDLFSDNTREGLKYNLKQYK